MLNELILNNFNTYDQNLDKEIDSFSKDKNNRNFSKAVEQYM